MKYIAQICILFINKLYNNIKNTRKKSGKCIVQNVVFNFLFFLKFYIYWYRKLTVLTVCIYVCYVLSFH